MSNIAERIRAIVNEHGDREAIVTSDRRLTYREFGRLVKGIQDHILAATPEPQRVGIMTDDRAHTYAAIVAVLASGAAYVPINSKNPPHRNLDVIRRAKLDLVLGRGDQFISELHAGLPGFLDVGQVDPNPEPWHVADVTDQALAYILFTSGSTGSPKGVPITQGNLKAFMSATFDGGPYRAEPGDRFLQMFELTFDLSVMCIFAPLCHGAAVCVVPEQGIGFMNVIKTLGDERVTVALMVPSVLSYMSRYMPELSFPEVRLNLFCGEALTNDLLTAWTACVPNASIENTYGPTEATIFCSRMPVPEMQSDDVFQGVVSIGRPLPGIELLVLDERGQTAAPGEQGELCIAGAQVMSGYWNEPDKTAEAMTAVAVNAREITVYRTGDIVFANERGNLMFCGRKDSQVKIDGHRVELGEIEHQAREFLGHAMAAALLVNSGDGRSTLVLFVELGAGQLAEALASHLAERLPDYMRPRIETLEKMPLNLNGKIDRPAIRKSFESAATSS